LRNVSFPKVLDLFEFCTDQLKQGLDLGREYDQKLRAEEDAKILEGKLQIEKKDKEGDVQMKDADEEESKDDAKA